MSSKHAPPFLTIDAELFAEQITLLQCSYGTSVVGLDRDRFEDWAPPIDVMVRLKMSVSNQELHHTLGFSQPTRVRAALLARCPKALYVHELGHRDFTISASAADEDFEFSESVSGTSICGALILELVLIRLEDFDGDEAVLHSISAGDILGRFEKRFDLEGEGSQFPTDVVRFNEDPELKAFRAAPWLLSTGGDLDAQFSSTRWKLYLNADHAWCQSFEALRTTEPSVGAFLKRDIVVALAKAVADHSDSLDEAGEEGSLRWVLHRFRAEQCERLFKTTDPEALRQACLEPETQSALVSYYTAPGVHS